MSTNLSHLFMLIDDDNPEVQLAIQEKLFTYALDLLLENPDFYEQVPPESFNHTDTFIKNNYLELLNHAFSQLMADNLEEIDLEKAAYLLCRWRSPKLRFMDFSTRLDSLSNDIAEDAPLNASPINILGFINNSLFRKHHFRGNTLDYYNPDNSFIHKVLETGQGIPISLSAIYLLIAKRLRIPIYGVEMPGHFILKYDDGDEEIFFDPYNAGQVFSQATCIDQLRELNVKNPSIVLEGCTHRDLFARSLRNLHGIYTQFQPSKEKADEIGRFLEIITEG